MQYKKGNLYLYYEEGSNAASYSFLPQDDSSPCLVEDGDTLVIFDEKRQRVITTIIVILDLNEIWPISGTNKYVNGRQKGFDLKLWISLFSNKHPAVLIPKGTEMDVVKKIVQSLIENLKQA